MTTTEERVKRDLSALRIDREETREESSLGQVVRWIVVLALIAGAIAFAYLKLIAPRNDPRVELLTVQPSVNIRTSQLLTATGYLVADRQATITPKVSGRVVKINFRVGDEVTAGQPLVVLESDEVRAVVSEAEAQYAEARREYERQASLWRSGVTSRALVDNAESQMKMARARLARVRVNLGDMIVRAPFAGTITTESVELGEIATPMTMGTPSGGRSGAIATLSDLESIEVEVDVNESNLGKLRVGTPAEVSVDAVPGRKFRGRVRTIIPTANRAKGVVQARVEILDDKSLLLPDMSATVSFLEREKTSSEIAEKPRIWVPASTVGRGSAGAYVAVIDPDNRVQHRPVTTGETREGRIEIVSGIAPGATIVASEIEQLKPGQRVRLPKQEE